MRNENCREDFAYRFVRRDVRMNRHYRSARLTVIHSCYRICWNVAGCYAASHNGGAVAQLGARLDGIEEAVGSNPIGSTNIQRDLFSDATSKHQQFAMIYLLAI